MITANHDQAIKNLIASIALEENSLSQVINTEAQKLNRLINSRGIPPHDLNSAKSCLHSMNQAISKLELILQAKIDFFDSEISQ